MPLVLRHSDFDWLSHTRGASIGTGVAAKSKSQNHCDEVLAPSGPREALGWEPTVDFEDGLQRTVDYSAHLPQSKLKAQERTVSRRTNPRDRARAQKPIRGSSISEA